MITRLLERAGRRPIAMGVVALALVVVVLVVVMYPILFGVRGDGIEIEAELQTTSEARLRDSVRVDGVKVGEITAMDVRPERGTALIKMRVDSDVPVKRDARVSLRWRTLLGGSFYVDLDPGSPSLPKLDRVSIPRSRATAQVEFDDLLQPFDGKTGQRLRGMLRGLREGFDDPAATGQALDALAPAMRSVRDGLTPLRGDPRRGDLRRLVASTARTTSGLGRDTGALERLVADAATTLRTTGDRRGNLGRLIAEAPPALDDTRTTAHRIDRTLARLDPLVAQLRPGARALDPTLRVARPLLDDATATLRDVRPLLEELDPALRALQGTSREGRPLLKGLMPTLARLDDTLLPAFAKVDPDTRRTTAQMIGPTFAVASSAASEFDGEGYWLRFQPTPGERTLLVSPCLPMLTDPTQPQKLRCEALQQTLQKLFSPRGRSR